MLACNRIVNNTIEKVIAIFIRCVRIRCIVYIYRSKNGPINIYNAPDACIYLNPAIARFKYAVSFFFLTFFNTAIFIQVNRLLINVVAICINTKQPNLPTCTDEIADF